MNTALWTGFGFAIGLFGFLLAFSWLFSETYGALEPDEN